jgi:hypothetical protein
MLGGKAMTEEKSDSGLMEEFYALGQQLSTAVKALWESEESRQLRQEIGEGFMELGRQVDTAVQSAQESEAAKQFSEQVQEAMDRARESDLAAQLEEGLVTGLRDLNKGLSKLVDSLGSSESAEQAPEDETAAESENEA